MQVFVVVLGVEAVGRCRYLLIVSVGSCDLRGSREEVCGEMFSGGIDHGPFSCF